MPISYIIDVPQSFYYKTTVMVSQEVDSKSFQQCWWV
jgi:hypothetical protein